MGQYKFGKPDEEIDFVDFQKKISKSKISYRKKAYLTLLYWIGCRRSEPFVILKEDIEEKNNRLYISIHYREDEEGNRIEYSRGKRGLAGGPSEIPLTLFGVEWIRKAWQHTKKGRKVFPFSDSTGYRAMKKLWPKKSPHWLRYNRVTKLRKRIGKEKDGLTIDAIKSFTGIRRDTTIQNYGLKTKADIHKIASLLE